jgi:hypothetical protein
MLKRSLTLDITHSNQNPVPVQVDMVKSHYIQSASDNIAGVYDLHCFESAAECFEFIDSLQLYNKYLFPVAESVEGSVLGQNPMQRESKATHKWPASNLLPGRSNPASYLHQIVS